MPELFGQFVSMIWPLLLLFLLIFGLIWFITSGPLGAVFKTLFGALKTITGAIGGLEKTVTKGAEKAIGATTSGHVPWHIPGTPTSSSGIGGAILGGLTLGIA